MNILALDLGTHCGYAYNRGPFEIKNGQQIPYEFHCGTWDLATSKEIRQWSRERRTRTNDPRIEGLCRKLSALEKFDLIVWEDVQFSSYTLQVQLWSALRSCIWLCAKSNLFECVPVMTLKKFAGSGKADKKAMSQFLQSQQPSLWKLTNNNDNTIDAVWAWLWARHTFARMKK